jgi:hypothetical protein
VAHSNGLIALKSITISIFKTTSTAMAREALHLFFLISVFLVSSNAGLIAYGLCQSGCNRYVLLKYVTNN